jgi:hypothetical protein
MQWVRAGVKKEATHVLIVCDTYDWGDYPVYVKKDQDVRQVASENNGPNMTRLMEVYSLTSKHTLKEQFAFEGRVFNWD